MRPRAALECLSATGLLLAMAPTGCSGVPALPGKDNGGLAIVVTQVPPRNHGTRVVDRLSLDDRYPTGSRVILIPSTTEPQEAWILSGKLSSAGAPDVSPGADSVLFAGKRNPDSRWGIYETSITSLSPQPVIETDRDCTDPAYLSGDRLVFVCVDEAPLTQHQRRTGSLYVGSRNGTDVERITFGPGSAFDPTSLQDGRILFTLCQDEVPGGSGREVAALFTVNPDGTLLDAFAGNHQPPLFKFRARQGGDGSVIFMTAGRDDTSLQVERVELSRPMATRQELISTSSVTSHGRFLAPSAAEALPEGKLVFTAEVANAATPEEETRGVYLFDPDDDEVERVFDSPTWDEVEAVPFLPTVEPRGRPYEPDHKLRTGTLICYDTRRSRDPVEKSALVVVERAEETPMGSALSSPGDARLPLRGSVSRLGEAAVEDDGSFYIEVPADVPIRVRTLARDGETVATSGWFWVRPGEVRACFGCHENRETAPVNRSVDALSRPPSHLEPRDDKSHEATRIPS